MRKRTVSAILVICASICLLSSCGQNSQVSAQKSEALQQIVTKVEKQAEASEKIIDQINSNGIDEESIRSIKESDDTGTVEMEKFIVSYDKDQSLQTGSMFSDSPEIPDSSSSLAFMFAKMQMELAQQNKDSAMQYIERIQEAQTKQKQAAQFLQTARTQAEALKAALGKNSPDEQKKAMTMPDEMKVFLQQNSMANCLQAASNGLFDKSAWTLVIYSLESYLEMLSTEIQSQMVYIQDFMGQYNSYMQGSSSSMQQGMQTLDSIARGQSLFSANGVTVTIVPAATAAIAGVLLGMLGMWLIMRKRSKGTGGDSK